MCHHCELVCVLVTVFSPPTLPLPPFLPPSSKHSPTQDLSPHYSCIVSHSFKFKTAFPLPVVLAPPISLPCIAPPITPYQDPSANYGMAASISNLQTYNMTCKEVVPPQAYNMSCKEVVPPQAYNMTFERSWGESYENVKNCKHDESCATAV